MTDVESNIICYKAEVYLYQNYTKWEKKVNKFDKNLFRERILINIMSWRKIFR